jgi:hypothetical protein
MVLVLPIALIGPVGSKRAVFRFSSGEDIYKGSGMADWNTLNQFWRQRPSGEVSYRPGASSAPLRSASGKPHETGMPESMIRATEEV